MVALPTRGQADWDDEIANAFSAIESVSNTANAAASSAVSTANAASSTANAAEVTADAAAATATTALVNADTAQAAANAAQATADAAIATNDEIIAAQVDDAASLTREALDALFESQPGAELGYAELEADFTTTNTSNVNVTDGPGAGGVIPQLTIGPIAGVGRAVSIEFHAPQVRHTTANAFVNAYLIVNGVANGGEGQNSLSDSPATNIGRELNMRRRLVLTDGVPYTFKVGIQGGVAGTTTIDGADGTAISLSVIGR